jgi:hypothetical protein
MIRSVLLIASTGLIAGAALAPAAPAAILGPDGGVTATRTGATVDVTFTPAALAASRLRAGTTVSLDCSVQHARSPLALVAIDEADQDGSEDDLTWGDAKVGADGVAHVKLYANTSDNAPGAVDSCDVARVRHLAKHSTVDTPVARIGLTPTGVDHVDVIARATALRHLIRRAHAANGYQPVAALGAGVVAMDSPEATPPAGQTGYWTDGTHAAVATLSAAGRRLVIQDLGGDVLRTNVLAEMDPYGEDDDLPAGTSIPSSSLRPVKSPEADRTPSPAKGDPLTPADGVRVAISGRRATVRFTGRSARTFRKLHGRRVAVVCQSVPPLQVLPSLVEDYLSAPSAAGGVARVPARGGAVTVTLKGAARDVCDVVDDGHEVAVAGATARGRAWVQDLAALLVLTGGGTPRLAAPGGQAYLPTGQLAATGRKDGYVAMSGPDGAVPVGRIGIWSDGARQAAVAVQSASGHRFMEVDEGDGVVRSNLASVVSYLFISETFSLADTSDSSSGSGSSSGSFSGEFDSK